MTNDEIKRLRAENAEQKARIDRLNILCEQWRLEAGTNEILAADAREKAIDDAYWAAKCSCLVPPDGGSPTEDEARMALRAAHAVWRLKGSDAPVPEADAYVRGRLEGLRMAAKALSDAANEDDVPASDYAIICRTHARAVQALIDAEPKPGTTIVTDGSGWDYALDENGNPKIFVLPKPGEGDV